MGDAVMDEKWIRDMSAARMDPDEALVQIPRLVHLAVTLAQAGGSLADEVKRLRNERDAALNLLEGYAPGLVQRLRDQMAFDREEGR